MRVFVVYRPPHYDSVAQRYMDNLIRCLANYVCDRHPCIIVGDFNCPKIDWTNFTSGTDYMHGSLLSFVSQYGLSQFVHFATRGENILDIVLSNDEQIVSSISSAPHLGHSDHNMVNFTLGLKSLLPRDKNTKIISQRERAENQPSDYAWGKADYALAVFSRNALYKPTFYLLTFYLL